MRNNMRTVLIFSLFIFGVFFFSISFASDRKLDAIVKGLDFGISYSEIMNTLDTHSSENIQINAAHSNRLRIGVDNGFYNIFIDAKANDSDSPITVNTDEEFSVQIALDPGDALNQKALWLILFEGPNGWLYLDLNSSSFQPGQNITYEGSLVEIPQFDLFHGSTPVAGTWTFWFAVALEAGNEEYDLYYDGVVINVISEVSDIDAYCTGKAQQCSIYCGSYYDQDPNQVINCRWNCTLRGQKCLETGRWE